MFSRPEDALIYSRISLSLPSPSWGGRLEGAGFKPAPTPLSSLIDWI